MNKVVLVTGSTSGIGKAIAEQQIKQNHTVIINSDKQIGKDFLLKKFGNRPNIHYQKADIANKEELVALSDWIKKEFGVLDGLVVNAGVMPLPCGIDNITDESINKTIEVNFKGSFWTLKILGNLIKETSKSGAIVTITSVDGIIGEPYGVIYSATKAAIISLTKSFARYFSNPLIRVNAIAPGLVDTPLTDSTGEDPSWTTDVSIIKRIGKPEEIANMASFLLSEKASYLTGQIIAVDGGFTLK